MSSHGNTTDSTFKKTHQEVGSEHTTSGDVNAEHMNAVRSSGPADPDSETATSERGTYGVRVEDPQQEADLRSQGYTTKPSLAGEGGAPGPRETAGEEEMRARLSG